MISGSENAMWHLQADSSRLLIADGRKLHSSNMLRLVRLTDEASGHKMNARNSGALLARMDLNPHILICGAWWPARGIHLPVFLT